jgi:mono/diheme cytochrome c family protein
MRNALLPPSLAASLVWTVALGAPIQSPQPPAVDFASEIAPLFAARCIECHGPAKQRSGYRLDDRASALSGGDLHAPNIVPGDSAASPLWRFVAGLDEDVHMPPKGAALDSAEVDTLRRWIDAGAVWPAEEGATGHDALDWWSLRPLVAVAPPGAGHPIDAFVQIALAARGLTPAPEADARVLCRRLFFDLVGLPPTPEEVDEFVADPAADKYERLVDRLLASPRYGERWARHWLDAVHYGDTHGYDKDQPRANAWPYRDYVVRALNEDKPYARFVAEQLAGDVLYPGTRDGIDALGFIAAGPWDLIGHVEVSEDKIDGKIARHFDRDDMVGTALGVFTSVTVQCAQCHDHKFDPVSQEDYYGLQAVFAALDRADRAYDVDPDVATRRTELETSLRSLRANESALDAAEVDERARVTAALEEVTDALAALPAQQLVYAGTVHHGNGNFRGTGAAGGAPREVRVLARGQVTTPREIALPGALSALEPLLPSGAFELDAAGGEGARRAALARWITDERNPLTWRSIVNRVWHHHFGRGLADTPDDFGRMGTPPTHPELLDWLAVTFRDELGGSLKALHRLLVTSAAYKRSSVVRDARAEGLDNGNTLLWRGTSRKLEAEALRDAVLAVSGALDLTPGGPGFQDFVIEQPEHSPHYRYDLADPDDPRTFRRSIYRFVVRSQMQPFLTALDCADPSMRVGARNSSVSPNQALVLLNNGFVLAQSARFAARLRGEVPDDLGAQIARGVRLALGRSSTDHEQERLLRHASEHGLESVCRALFNLNAFIFID